MADVTDLSPRLPKPHVFFFDRTSAAAISLAKQAYDQKAIVFFEPSASSDPNQLEDALQIAHIVKVSAERIAGNDAVLNAAKPLIVIETQGGTGLRLRFRGSERETVARKWHKLPPIPVDTLRDTAGAGDWCSAGIIHMLGAKGAHGLDKLTLDEVRQAVQVGQAMASWTCGFDGPRGGMYVSETDAFQESVLSLLNGRTEGATYHTPYTTQSGKTRAFACESCRVSRPTNVKKSRR